MRAIISVSGKDTVGILAKVSGLCAEADVNILDVTQSVLQEFFVMVMLTDLDGMNLSFKEFTAKMTELGASIGMDIHVMHEDIFNSMHRI